MLCQSVTILWTYHRPTCRSYGPIYDTYGAVISLQQCHHRPKGCFPAVSPRTGPSSRTPNQIDSCIAYNIVHPYGTNLSYSGPKPKYCIAEERVQMDFSTTGPLVIAYTVLRSTRLENVGCMTYCKFARMGLTHSLFFIFLLLISLDSTWYLVPSRVVLERYLGNMYNTIGLYVILVFWALFFYE